MSLGAAVEQRTYPHPAVANGRPVLRQPQHKQVHLVLPPTTDAEAEALDALLQLHGEEVKVLRELRQCIRNVKSLKIAG